MHISTDKNDISRSDGFSMAELMVVLVIIGVLVLLALPKLMPLVTKAKTTEAKLMLKQVYTLEQSYKFEHDRYSTVLTDMGFEQEKLTTEGGQARYKIDGIAADEKVFAAQATSVVDFDNDGIYNVWVVDQTGAIKEKVPDWMVRLQSAIFQRCRFLNHKVGLTLIGGYSVFQDFFPCNFHVVEQATVCASIC